MDKIQKIEISPKSIIWFFLILISIVLLYYIRNVLLMLFIVAIIVAALDPLVTRAETEKVPRFVSALFIYLALLVLLVLCIYLLIPPIAMQISNLQDNLPIYIDQVTPYFQFATHYVNDWQKLLGTISQNLSSITGGIVDVAVKIFGGLTTFFTILIISFYLLIDRPQAEKFLLSVIPIKKRESVIKIMEGIGYKIGGWLRGQFILSLVMGTSTAIIAAIAQVPYALILGLIAALLEIFPVVGVTIVGILVVCSTWFFGGFIKAMIVLAIFVGLHQLESSILIPKVMGKAVELSPAIILVALLIGGTLAGIPGAILAIPAAAGIAVFLKEWPKLREK